MKSLKQFIYEGSGVVLPERTTPQGQDADFIDNLNEALDTLSDTDYDDIEDGVSAIVETLTANGIEVPSELLHEGEDEVVYRIDGVEDQYLYMYREENESGKQNLFAAIVDEDGLHQLLNIESDDNDE